MALTLTFFYGIFLNPNLIKWNEVNLPTDTLSGPLDDSTPVKLLFRTDFRITYTSVSYILKFYFNCIKQMY
jgi:hypothetical protein